MIDIHIQLNDDAREMEERLKQKKGRVDAFIFFRLVQESMTQKYLYPLLIGVNVAAIALNLTLDMDWLPLLLLDLGVWLTPFLLVYLIQNQRLSDPKTEPRPGATPAFWGYPREVYKKAELTSFLVVVVLLSPFVVFSLIASLLDMWWLFWLFFIAWLSSMSKVQEPIIKTLYRRWFPG